MKANNINEICLKFDGIILPVALQTHARTDVSSSAVLKQLQKEGNSNSLTLKMKVKSMDYLSAVRRPLVDTQTPTNHGTPMYSLCTAYV